MCCLLHVVTGVAIVSMAWTVCHGCVNVSVAFLGASVVMCVSMHCILSCTVLIDSPFYVALTTKAMLT